MNIERPAADSQGARPVYSSPRPPSLPKRRAKPGSSRALLLLLLLAIAAGTVMAVIDSRIDAFLERLFPTELD